MVVIMGYQLVVSLVSDYMFKQDADRYIELTEQSMMADGVSASETRYLSSGLRGLSNGVSSYVTRNSTLQIALSANMLLLIFAVCRKD
jgi:hypothetical protein